MSNLSVNALTKCPYCIFLSRHLLFQPGTIFFQSSSFCFKINRADVSKAAPMFCFQSCCELMFLNLFCVAVALLLVSPQPLSQIYELYLEKTAVARCLRGVFPAPAWTVSASLRAESWIAPPLLLSPLVCLWVVALYPAHPGDASPAAAYLWAAHWPTEWHQLPSCVPGPQFPPQLLREAGEMRASLHPETVLSRHLRFFLKQTALENTHHREGAMIRMSDCQHCFCLV